MKTKTYFYLSLFCICSSLLFHVNAGAQSVTYQPVTIEGMGTFADPCSYFKWWVRYKLPQKSTNGGFIIQHVKIKYIITDCNDRVIDGSVRKDPGYFEAWPVDSGSTAPAFIGNAAYHDTYSMPIRINTKGKVSWQATIVFVENPTPNRPAIDTNNWHRHPGHASGGLLHTTTMPSVWDSTAISNFGKKHNAYFEWECCDKDTIGKVIRLDTTENAPVVILPEDTIPQDTTHNGDGNDEDGRGDFIRPLDELRYEYLQQKTMQQGLKSQSTLSQTESAPRSKGFMRLYPVPAAQYAVLEFPAYAEKAWRVRIMNLNGQLVKEEEWKDVVGKLRLDLSSLAPGIYLLHASNADGSLQEHFKLIRQK